MLSSANRRIHCISVAFFTCLAAPFVGRRPKILTVASFSSAATYCFPAFLWPMSRSSVASSACLALTLSCLFCLVSLRCSANNAAASFFSPAASAFRRSKSAIIASRVIRRCRFLMRSSELVTLQVPCTSPCLSSFLVSRPPLLRVFILLSMSPKCTSRAVGTIIDSSCFSVWAMSKHLSPVYPLRLLCMHIRSKYPSSVSLCPRNNANVSSWLFLLTPMSVVDASAALLMALMVSRFELLKADFTCV